MYFFWKNYSGQIVNNFFFFYIYTFLRFIGLTKYVLMNKS